MHCHWGIHHAAGRKSYDFRYTGLPRGFQHRRQLLVTHGGSPICRHVHVSIRTPRRHVAALRAIPYPPQLVLARSNWYAATLVARYRPEIPSIFDQAASGVYPDYYTLEIRYREIPRILQGIMMSFCRHVFDRDSNE